MSMYHQSAQVMDDLRRLQSVPPLDKELDYKHHAARATLDQAKETLEAIEAMAADDVYGDASLKNAEQRKARLTLKLSQNDSYKAASQAVRDAQMALRRIETDMEASKEARKAHGLELASVGKQADLVSYGLYEVACQAQLEASLNRLRVVAK